MSSEVASLLMSLDGVIFPRFVRVSQDNGQWESSANQNTLCDASPIADVLTLTKDRD